MLAPSRLGVNVIPNLRGQIPVSGYRMTTGRRSRPHRTCF
jgi:hypothetical protein